MAQKKVTDIKEADKSKQLDSALGQIERQFGSGTVMRMGEKDMRNSCHSNWFIRFRYCARNRWITPRKNS